MNHIHTFLIKSRIDYPIQEEFIHKILNSGESVLVENTKAFKSFYSAPNFKIMIGKDGLIIFDGSNSGFGVKHGLGFLDCEIDFECPRKPFKGLFKFMGASNANFEILKMILPEFVIRGEYYSTHVSFRVQNLN